MCQRCGYRCSVCGWHPDEPLVKPEPVGADPVGPDREFCCRYCHYVAPTARSLEEHQARHRGVGPMLVTDEIGGVDA